MQQQNLASLVVTKELQAQLLSLIQQFRQHLPGLIALEADERKALTMMGPKSEGFARLGLVQMRQNPDLMPRGLDMDGAFADLEARDNLIPVLQALQQLIEELDDTVAALGSDVMVVANLVYGILKSAGGGAGLDEAVREMSIRHKKSRKKTEKPQADSER
ncbi:hypothetical protein LVB87_03345 [Lysobacter sp. KIS68-7]|uniref:hypothetical protein n=1 Tax=Lysobacter sp. KIS68-7 TaxID=2904252 RepID=UPI001E5BDC58|nr:hypothetical protein [Lysobacter sp. KIS68-7]UHQ20211.1 hypothetical protein LVB87_03345 [Lysobacter sp. KIS68-7]